MKRLSRCPAPPLDGFDVPFLPAEKVAEVANALERSAQMRSGAKGTLLAAKLRERAAEIRQAVRS